MTIKTRDLICVFFILIISLIFVADLFTNIGTPATFDQPTHLANIAQFYRAILDGDLPARWGDGFGNYGMPIPLIAQQMTSYLGAFLNFLTHDIILSYNLVIFTGTFLSGVFFYVFLRLYFEAEPSLLAVFLFNFAPYRILNIYIRGSLPEFFSAVFLPILLIGIFLLVQRNKLYGGVIIAASVAGIILSHPFMLLVYAAIYIPYAITLLILSQHKFKSIISLSTAFIIGIGLTGYYLFPLLLEIKYFYYGLAKSHYIPNYFLSLQNFIDPYWYYYYQNDTYVRGHVLSAGLFETAILTFFIITLILGKVRNDRITKHFIWLIPVTGILCVILMIPISDFLYRKISVLGNIQRPWRFLSTYIFLPSMALAYLTSNMKKRFLVVIMTFIIVLRFPQLYGKNYFIQPQQSYFYTMENLHGTILNTIWTSDTKDYPVKKIKGEIIEGKGKIVDIVIKNSRRSYTVIAESDIRMVDYTFYFPGWKVYTDNKPTEIQFQDPKYRGVITYNVPKGKHIILLKFEETKIRYLSNILSVFFSAIFIILGSIVCKHEILSVKARISSRI